MNNLSSFTNLLLKVDSYVHSFFNQYDKNATNSMAYIESRGGKFDQVVFFGLQAILKEHFSNPITHADIDEAKDVLLAHGLPFDEKSWRNIVYKHNGRLPLKIKAIKEGTWVPVKNALITIETTDPDYVWLPAFIEAVILRVWYPTTIATLSGYIKRHFHKLSIKSSDNLESTNFLLHNFGARSVTSNESSVIAGISTMVFHLGTDILAALAGVNMYYGKPNTKIDVKGFSIPASAHTTITSWGKEKEINAYRNLIDTYLTKEGSIVACVSDSYNYEHVVKNIWCGELKEQIINSGGTLVVRPDSGDPMETVMETLGWLEEGFGTTLNSKGYKLLNNVRIIQGDGLDYEKILEISNAVVDKGFALETVAYGMGSNLVQAVGRDDQKFAQKTCAVETNGIWDATYKEPVGEAYKASKKLGRLTLARNKNTGEYKTVALSDLNSEWLEVLEPVWHNGFLVREQSFDQIRERADLF